MEVFRTDQFQDSPDSDWRSSQIDVIMALLKPLLVREDKVHKMLNSMSDDELYEYRLKLSSGEY